MLNFYKISIRIKIIIIILTVSISGLLIGFSALFFYFVNESERILLNNAELHAKLIAEYSVSPIDFNDKKGALDILSKSENVKEIVFSRIYDSNNTIFAEYGNKTELVEFDTIGQERRLIIEEDYIHFFQPVIYKDKFIGTVYLLITKNYFKAERLNYFIRFMLLFIFILILVVIASIQLQKYISKPILELANKINQSASSGDYTKRIVGEYEDEIGELYKGYNNFLDQINKRELEKENAQKEVLEHEQHLNSIFNAADNVSFIVTDLNGKESIIKDFSPGAEKLFGYRKNEILEKKVATLYKSDEINLLDSVKKLEASETVEVIFIRKDGKEFPALLTIHPWYNYKGEVIGTIGVSVDITELKDVERELKKHKDNLENLVKERTTELEIKANEAQKAQMSLTYLVEDVNESRLELEDSNIKLEQANKELEAFSYSVSHDLRAPLRAIDGFTRILMEDYVSSLDAEAMRLGSVIQDNAQKMGELIDDLLTFSRMGRTTMSFSEIDMKNMANAIYHEVTDVEERKRIDFSIGDLPRVEGDTTMMRQVWVNLISNAVKFSAKRERTVISVSCDTKEEELIYTIKDNGAGFNMKYKDKLFGVFQRLHGDKEFEGTGVGLALVQRIIQRHGGEIWAQSELDKGAVFFFSLSRKRIRSS